MMRSIESASSVFYHSQEEDSLKTDPLGACRDALAGPLCDSYPDSVTDGSPVTRDAEPPGRHNQTFGPTVRTRVDQPGSGRVVTYDRNPLVFIHNIFLFEFQVLTVRRLLDAVHTAPTR